MSIYMETTDTAVVDVPTASYSYATSDCCCDICGAKVKNFRANIFILCESCERRINAHDDMSDGLDYEYLTDDIGYESDWY